MKSRQSYNRDNATRTITSKSIIFASMSEEDFSFQLLHVSSCAVKPQCTKDYIFLLEWGYVKVFFIRVASYMKPQFAYKGSDWNLLPFEGSIN